jgi:hypothetical protein
MWSAEQLLNFTRARDNSQFLNVAFANDLLNFDFTFAGAARTDLTLMIPATWQTDALASLEINGQPITWILQNIKGIDYAMFTPQIMNGHITATFVAPFLAGDFNHNGTVDMADYVLWRSTLGSTTNLAADGNGNHLIDDGDYAVWRNNFGHKQAAQSLSAVPEPGLCVLLLFSLAILLFIRQQRVHFN